MEFSVVTFNIYNDKLTFDERLPLILEALDEADAHVIALQEVPPGRGIAEMLADDLGGLYWTEAVFVRPDDGWTEALAVLSRFPIFETEKIDLRPGVPNCIRARLDTEYGPVDVYNTHLHPRDSELRQREVSLILRRIEREPALPAIVAGDFNAVAGGATMAGPLRTFRSAYEACNGRHPDTTFPTPFRPDVLGRANYAATREGPAGPDPSGEARSAIDFVLVRPKEFEATEAKLIGVKPSPADPALWPSDHYGVLVTLKKR